MGYKLAGYDVIGDLEIDKRMNSIYLANHNPKHNFVMDIREFNEIDDSPIPKELFDLDILDGSPPCTTFSMAGKRKKSWGVKKKFREGQKEQTLDDLSFVFIDTVKKLRPRFVIMENVEGLTKGNACSNDGEILSYLEEQNYVTSDDEEGIIAENSDSIDRLRYFIGDTYSADLYRIDGYGNLENVTSEDLKDLCDDLIHELRREIQDLLRNEM